MTILLYSWMPRNEKETRTRGWIPSNTRIGPVLNIKVCYRDEKYRIEVQVPSLFQDNTVSWVRIVNGVDKYVTESMLTTKEEAIGSGNTIAKARPRQKPAEALTPVSILVFEEYGSTLKHNNQMIKSVSQCQKQSLDHCDVINQFLEETTERSTTMTSLKIAGGRSSTTLRSGYLKIGYQNWQREAHM